MSFQNRSNLPHPAIRSQQKSNTPVQPSLHQQSLQNTIQERQRLQAAEHSSQDPIKTTVTQRGQLLERRIGQMQNKYGK